MMEYTPLEKTLLSFSPEDFIRTVTRVIALEVTRQRFDGVVFGASGGIDSLVTAALCIKARDQEGAWRVVGLQMNDSRVKGETYNSGLYRAMDIDLEEVDITREAIEGERREGMPPRRLTMGLMVIVLRWLPDGPKRWVILATKSGEAPKWALKHLRLLTLLHRIRIARLSEYAAHHRLIVIICANLTEATLGYFVEQGVDDSSMGDYAPLFGLYKSQVIRTARVLGIPERVISQPPSPGFGGVHDEEILGPYELVDLTLVGLKKGYSDAQISRFLKPYALKWRRRKGPFDERHIRFLRQLADLAAHKGPAEHK